MITPWLNLPPSFHGLALFQDASLLGLYLFQGAFYLGFELLSTDSLLFSLNISGLHVESSGKTDAGPRPRPRKVSVLLVLRITPWDIRTWHGLALFHVFTIVVDLLSQGELGKDGENPPLWTYKVLCSAQSAAQDTQDLQGQLLHSAPAVIYLQSLKMVLSQYRYACSTVEMSKIWERDEDRIFCS